MRIEEETKRHPLYPLHPCRLFCIVLVAAAAGICPGAPKAVRLLAEAEDFRVQRGAWQVVPYRRNYYATTFAISFLSRMACLGAPAQVTQGQDAVAEQVVDVPVAAEYRVAARYEQPQDFSAEFAVEIEQGGKALYRRTFGRLDDPKIWAFVGHKRLPMARYSWGGTDNIVWQRIGAVKLAGGPATIRLIAGPQLDGSKPRRMAGRRHVDVICLTNDAAGLEAQTKTRYLEMDGWLVQDGDLFVRFTNPKDGLGPCVPIVKPLSGGQHSPYWVHVRDWPTTLVVRSGRLVTETSYRIAGPRSTAVRPKLLAPLVGRADPKRKDLTDEQYLRPGERSGWVPMGQVLDALHDCHWFPAARYKQDTKGRLDLELELAVPDGRGGLEVVRKIRVRGKGGYLSPITFLMPGNVAARPVIRTQVEWLRWLNAEVAKFPKRGRRPKRFPIYGILEFSGAASRDDEIGREATRLALALGSNTISPLRSPWAKRMGAAERRNLCVCHWRPTSIASLEKNCARAEKDGLLKSIAIVSYGDEIHIPPVKGTAEEFAAWLKKRGVQVSGAPEPTDDRASPLYYHSRLWAVEKGIQHYADATAWLQRRMGAGLLTGANYSPHANYLVTDLQWVRPFKAKAMTLPWSEDYVWTVPQFSLQVVGYLVSAFRCGAKYHDLPILMYVMPHSPGNTPRDFRLSFYTCVGHGAKKIHYFCASPLAVGTTENYIATDDLAMWRAVHDVTHEAGLFEEYVLDGKVRPAKVALLLSSVDEILTGDTNFRGAIHNQERKAVYYALRHAQVPVDFLTEDDVIDGLAGDYRLIYVTQQYLHSKAAAALRRWVERGGTLVALCGGGFVNEFAKPNPQAEALYGAKSQGITKDPKLTQILAKQDLPPSKPLDTAGWTAGKTTVSGVEVIAWKQALVPAGAEVLGRFADKRPAVVARRHGKGRAVLFGFLPGLAYLKSGLPLRPPDRGATNAAFGHFLPTEMRVDLRQALVDDFLPADFARPVECSAPLVEWTCIDTPKPARLAVPLVNYSGKPIAELTVKVAGLARAKSVRSVHHERLQPTFRDGHMTVRLPLAVADMLLIDR